MPGNTEVPRLAYSPGELAEALGCTREHVHNLIRRGELPSLKLGRRRLIRAEVLHDLLARLEAQEVAS